MTVQTSLTLAHAHLLHSGSGEFMRTKVPSLVRAPRWKRYCQISAPRYISTLAWYTPSYRPSLHSCQVGVLYLLGLAGLLSHELLSWPFCVEPCVCLMVVWFSGYSVRVCAHHCIHYIAFLVFGYAVFWVEQFLS